MDMKPEPSSTAPTTTMRAMTLPRASRPAAFETRTVERPAPGPNQIEVRVQSAALNPADLKVARGDFFARVLHARVSPLVVGYDYAGIVERVGEGTTARRPGDAVFGFLPYSSKTRTGTFAEHVVVDASITALRPDRVPAEIAAASATPGVTAIHALRDHGRLRAGQRVLIIGASGGVGTVAIGVAKRLGAHVTGLCSAHAVELVQMLGADEVVDRARQHPRDLGTFDVILDVAAAYSYASLRRALAPRGAYVTTLPSAAFAASALLALFSSRRNRFVAVRPVSADLELLASWLGDGMRVPIDSRFPVRELGPALDRLGRGTMRGRIGIDVEGGF